MMKGFPDLPPIWWLASIAVIYAGVSLFPEAHLSIPGQRPLGWLLSAIAIALIVWSAIWFLRKRTPIEPHHTPKALVVEGPFRLSRNPIYLSLVLLTLSTAVAKGSILGLVVAAGLAWVLHTRFVLPEEAELRKAFGSASEAYFKSTRRWV